MHDAPRCAPSSLTTRLPPRAKSSSSYQDSSIVHTNDKATSADVKPRTLHLAANESTSTSNRLLCATSTANSRKAEEVRNCLTDEGRPLGVGLQEQTPNHLRRLWPKATVVNAEGKGSDVTGSGDRQEEDRKGTTAEVSKVIRRWPKP